MSAAGRRWRQREKKDKKTNRMEGKQSETEKDEVEKAILQNCLYGWALMILRAGGLTVCT